MIMFTRCLLYANLLVLPMFMVGIMYKVNQFIAGAHDYDLSVKLNLLICVGEVLLFYLLGYLSERSKKKSIDRADSSNLPPNAEAAGKSKFPFILTALLLFGLFFMIKSMFDLFAFF